MHRNVKSIISRACRVVASACLVVTVLVGFQSCKDDKNDSKNDPRVDRTVIVYMVADNSLGYQENDRKDLEEMVVAAENGDLGNSRLLVYRSARNADPVLLEVKPEGLVTLKEYDTSKPSVTYARMKEAIADAKEQAPARKYGIILWGHGSGWLENGMSEPELEGKSFGSDRNGRWMNMSTLREVLRGESFDWVYFDCCYMAGVEVVYELRDVTDHIVASATELPADGMPYDRNLSCLMPSNSNLLQACKNTFELYDGMVGVNRTCTMTLVDTKGLDLLAKVTREVMAAGTELPDDFRPQKFMTSSNCYHYDFEQYVMALMPDDADLSARWKTALDATVVYEASTPYIWNEVALKNHCGLSTFILKNREAASDRNHYDRLQWWNDVVSCRF